MKILKVKKSDAPAINPAIALLRKEMLDCASEISHARSLTSRLGGRVAEKTTGNNDVLDALRKITSTLKQAGNDFNQINWKAALQ